IPDENLGQYVEQYVPEKTFIFNKGFCPIHKSMNKALVLEAKAQYPEAEILIHPECTPDVVALGDYVGSTSGIIEYATKSTSQQFIVCTEIGIEYALQKNNPDKVFHFVGDMRACGSMKCVTLETLYNALKDEQYEITLDEAIMKKAEHALLEMHRLAD
ncbi:MAG: quinolinate synthase NadA, partial [Niameybacter sp.]